MWARPTPGRITAASTWRVTAGASAPSRPGPTCRPFSGTATSHYADGVIESKIQYRNGQRHGKETGWYPSGELKHVVRYKKGEPQSLGSSWHSEAKPEPEPLSFALCSEHPELNSVCGEADTSDVSHFESCADKSC